MEQKVISLKKDIDKTSLTYKLFPLGKNKILARIENLADRFDPNLEESEEVQYVDVEDFARQLYKEANPNSKLSIECKIVETSIDHAAKNQLAGIDWDESRWIGQDDKNITYGNRKRPVDLS